MTKEINEVSIKFRAGAYGAYRSMNNRAHYALAEYVDNALQSYITHKDKLHQIEGADYQFRIDLTIDLENDYIKIHDNAGGIESENFLRAFEPANIPADNTGLSEFGMGMKIASIWFADFYSIKSTSINESVERFVEFDLNKVMKEEKEELSVSNNKVLQNDHYTTIYLEGLSSNAPSTRGGAMRKISDHLASIYRKFILSGELELYFNGELLTYIEPEILHAPYYKDLDSSSIEWKEELSFSAGKYKVKGFVGLLKEMSTNNCGFSLFRRGRVIKGSHDEKYHPKVLCGQSGSPRDKRLFGEFELEGFDVSFDKGSFTQMEELDEILHTFKDELTAKSRNILKQGDKYRKVKKVNKAKIVKQTLDDVKKASFDNEEKTKLADAVKQINVTPQKIESKPFESENKYQTITRSFPWNNKDFQFRIEYINDPGQDLIQISNSGQLEFNAALNLGHPYFRKYRIVEEGRLKPIIALLEALVMAEAISTSQGTQYGGYIRQNLSKILKA